MKTKKFFAALLALCMVLSILPLSASAQMFDRSIITGTAGLSADHTVYFGQYGGSPIQWQVLNPTFTNAGGNGAFLISEYLMGNTIFGTNTTWAGSTAQQWCTNLISNTSNFSTTESGAILPTTKADGPYFPYGASALSGEKAFFLSAEEAITYFFDNNARTARFISGSASPWWLRSPSNVDNAGTVSDSGALASGWDALPLCARPALNLNPASVLFLSAATGGKSNGAEGALNAVTSVNMTPPKWKLTLLDNSRSGFSIATTAVAAGSVTLSYSGAATGTNEYISAAFTDFVSGAVTYYGRIKHIPDASDASGSVTIGIPGGVMPGANGTLLVFNEQYNGGASDNTYLTDYASPMRTVSNTVNAYALTVVNGTDNTGGSPYASGAQVSITADAAPAGKRFKEWVSNNGGTFGNAASASTTFTMPAAAATVTATYEDIPQPGDAPEITQQPQNTSVSEGNTAIFTVAATGMAPLTYQWQVDRNDASGWQDVGENSASYTTPSTQLSDSGYQYRCKVSNSAGEAISGTAVLTVTTTWQPAFAVTGGTAGTDYTYGANGMLIFTQSGTYAVSMTTPGAITAADRIVVQSGVMADITLSDVNIDVSAAGFCAFEMYGAAVNLTLEGQNTLRSGYDYAGIHCPNGATLTIGGTGALSVTGGENGAGIGGNNGERGGAIQINSGTVTTTGGTGGAGIGGGRFGRGGSITIDGGAATAMGGTGGAGIGGGTLGGGGTIEINGGTVAATGGQTGAGIGGGEYRPSGDIAISGGTITAESESGAGVGGGAYGNCGDIAVTGGTVTAASVTGAGIGGGDGGDGGSITISGGTVNSTVQGTPSNGPVNGDLPVSLVEATLPGIATVTKVSLLTIPGAPYYGTKDLYTDAGGRLYLWLPGSTEGTQARTADTVYNRNASGVFEADTAKPAVTGVTPAGTGVAHSGSLAVTFGEDMRDTAGTVTLNGTPLLGGSWNAGKTMHTIPYSGLQSGRVYTVTISGFADYSGNVMDITNSHSFATAIAPDNDDDDDIFRTLTDSATGVTVSGDIHTRAALIVKELDLHAKGTCAACDAIRKAQNDNQLILGFDIDLTQGFSGPLTISIPVGNQHNGQTLTILHCINGRLETLTATVVNGKATFTVTELSPFAVTTGLLVPDSVVTDPPKTGDNSSNLVGWLLCGVSAAGLPTLIVLGKRRKPYRR